MEQPAELVSRLLPLIRYIGCEVARRCDQPSLADDLTQEGLLAVLIAKEGQTDAWYANRARWAMNDAIKSARYKRLLDDHRAERSVASGIPASAVLDGLSDHARQVAVMRWAGADWQDCQAAVGRSRFRRARRELATHFEGDA